jgi:cobalt-zinc-cadmium efflux system membrane fusion protein
MKTLILFSSLLALVISLTGCHDAQATPEAAPEVKVEGDRIHIPDGNRQRTSIATEAVEPCQKSSLHFNGRLTWNEESTVRIFTPFGGRVIQILAEAGQTIEKGQTLALISSPDYGQAQADARKAVTDFLLAERTLNRVRELHDHGAAPLKDLQAAEADFSRTQSEKERTTSRLLAYGGKTNSLDQIYELKSPLRGVIVEKNINPGQEVRPDQMLANAQQFFAPLFVVTDPAKLWVQVDATEQDLPHLRKGQPLLVHSRAYPETAFAGSIEAISDFLDPVTRTIKLRGAVANADRILKAEMFVTVDVPSNHQQGLDVSARAVYLDGDKHYVILEEKPGDYIRREVKSGAEHEGKVLILGGIEAGQRVVTDGSLLLKQMLLTPQGAGA